MTVGSNQTQCRHWLRGRHWSCFFQALSCVGERATRYTLRRNTESKIKIRFFFKLFIVYVSLLQSLRNIFQRLVIKITEALFFPPYEDSFRLGHWFPTGGELPTSREF